MKAIVAIIKYFPILAEDMILKVTLEYRNCLIITCGVTVIFRVIPPDPLGDHRD